MHRYNWPATSLYTICSHAYILLYNTKVFTILNSEAVSIIHFVRVNEALYKKSYKILNVYEQSCHIF